MARVRAVVVPKLPAFIRPMLAKLGQPFDSDEHLFEIKWDGTRSLCFIDKGSYRLVNRRQIDMTYRYPEFAFLQEFPPGTVLDGEMVVLKDGKPSFPLLQSRDHARSPLKIRTLSGAMPATYVVFDMLYHRGRSIMNEPLRRRRRLLEGLLKDRPQSHLVLSKGVTGQGQAYFDLAVAQDLEGIIAKSLDSKYLPGQRTDAWIKIKRSLELCCVIIGFEPSGKDDFRNVIVAIEEDGELRCIGKVGSGFDNALRRKLNRWLLGHLRSKPVVPCKHPGKWVEAELLCRVSCMERSTHGDMRAPAFKGLVEG
jgi:bifunctional non-homologous end joining protein LigD